MHLRLAFVALLAMSPAAFADVQVMLPEFNGPSVSSGFPAPALPVGTFNFAPPSSSCINSVRVSGTFGNSVTSSCAGVDIFVDGVLVGQCLQTGACYSGGPTPWSFEFSPSQYGLVADGQMDMTAVQTAPTVIRLGSLRLRIQDGGTFCSDVTSVSVSSGGSQVLTLGPGASHAFKPYQSLGSLSGDTPGFGYAGWLIPLNPDAYALYTLLNPNQPPLLNSAGTLDSSGSATTVFQLLPGGDPALVGLQAHHAYVVIDAVSLGLDFVSNALPVDLTL